MRLKKARATKARRSVKKRSGGARHAETKAPPTKTLDKGKQRGAGRDSNKRKASAKENHTLAAASKSGQRKRPKRLRTAAEKHGLAHRDLVISETPEAQRPQNIMDQQFRFWLAMLRMSPLPIVLHQQATIARLIMDLMLPSKSGR